MLEFLAESAEDLSSTLRLEEVFEKIAERVRLLLDAHLFWLVGLDNVAQTAKDRGEARREARTARSGDGTVGHVDEAVSFPCASLSSAT